MIFFEKQIIYGDNHLVIAFKPPGLLSQKDKTGDDSILEMVKRYLKEKYGKPGDVFLGSVHRLDRPAMGLMIFAKTSKALMRMHHKFRNGEIEKHYLAIVEGIPPSDHGKLVHYLVKDPQKNIVKTFDSVGKDRKMAILEYNWIGQSGKFSLLNIRLETGRPHQIRVQMAAIGCPIAGDLKYGAKSKTGNQSICLLSAQIKFIHPVTDAVMQFYAPYPKSEKYWNLFDTPY